MRNGSFRSKAIDLAVLQRRSRERQVDRVARPKSYQPFWRLLRIVIGSVASAKTAEDALSLVAPKSCDSGYVCGIEPSQSR